MITNNYLSYIESGTSKKDWKNLCPRTKRFKKRYKRRWKIIETNLQKRMKLDKIPPYWNNKSTNERECRFRESQNFCRSCFGYQEHKWISKHYFMLRGPLAGKNRNGIQLPSVVLRNIFVCLYGHGP